MRRVVIRFAKLSDNFIIVRQVENVKWNFVTDSQWHSAGKPSSAMPFHVDEMWSHVELVWSYRGPTVELADSKPVGCGRKGMPNGALSLLNIAKHTKFDFLNAIINIGSYVTIPSPIMM